jgi:hypothetical protein
MSLHGLASLFSVLLLTSAPRPPHAVQCALTMAGAHAASVPCTAHLGSERGRGLSSLTITGEGVHLVVRVRGDLSTTRFSSADAISGAALGVHTASGAYWYYNRDVGGRGTPPAGGYELVLTELANSRGSDRPGDGDAESSRGSASGTLTATLPSGRAGGGVLTVTVRFEQP